LIHNLEAFQELQGAGITYSSAHPHSPQETAHVVSAHRPIIVLDLF